MALKPPKHIPDKSLRLQTVEPAQEFGVGSRVLRVIQTRHIRRRPELLEDTALVRQIGIEVSAGGADAGMAEPGFDDVGIDFGFQQMDRAGMPKAVRGKGFRDETRAAFCRGLQVSFDDGADAEACERAAALVDEEEIGRTGLGYSAMRLGVAFEQTDGGRPQRGDALFSAFAEDGDGPVGEVEPGESGVGGFGGPCTGVIKESQDRQIPNSVGSCDLRLGEQRFQFFPIQGFNSFGWNALDGDSENAPGVMIEGRMVQGNEMEEALDGDETLIAGLRAVAPTYLGIFEVLEEGEDGFDVQLDQGGVQKAAARSQKMQKKFEGIAIAFDGVGAERSLLEQIPLEEFFKLPGQVGGHEDLRTRWSDR